MTFWYGVRIRFLGLLEIERKSRPAVLSDETSLLGYRCRPPSVVRRRRGLHAQLPVEGEKSSSLHAARAKTSDSLSLRHRPEACRAVALLANWHTSTVISSTFAGFDHRLLLCTTCTELTEPSADEKFK